MQVATIDTSKSWTVEDYQNLEEGLLAQLIEGQLVMSPVPTLNHQRILRELFKVFDNYHLNGELFFSPIDVYLDDTTVFQPDLVFVSSAKASVISSRGIEGAPDLVVEVLSPSNSFIDRNVKKRRFLGGGVGEYWLVDPGNKTLEIYSDDPEQPILYLVESGTVTSTLLPEISFELASIFN
ncbi:MAG: Uma2 family endonuclease [Cyclobacteriaceae bacterium]